MSGHGHVIPNADGSKARCGGPAICATCARELASAPWIAYSEWMLIDPRYDLQKHAFAARIWREAQDEQWRRVEPARDKIIAEAMEYQRVGKLTAERAEAAEAREARLRARLSKAAIAYHAHGDPMVHALPFADCHVLFCAENRAALADVREITDVELRSVEVTEQGTGISFVEGKPHDRT